MKTIANINPKAAVAAAALQAKQDVRYYLNGIFIEPRDEGGVTIKATDGHGAISIVDPEGSVDEPRIASLDAATLNKCKAQKAERLEIVRYGEGADAIYLARVSGLSHHLSNPTVTVEIIDGRFPSFEQILPDVLPDESNPRAPAIAVRVAHKLLAAAKALKPTQPIIRITYNGAESAALISFATEGPLIARGAAMPIRADLPEWKA